MRTSWVIGCRTSTSMQSMGLRCIWRIWFGILAWSSCFTSWVKCCISVRHWFFRVWDRQIQQVAVAKDTFPVSNSVLDSRLVDGHIWHIHFFWRMCLQWLLWQLSDRLTTKPTSLEQKVHRDIVISCLTWATLICAPCRSDILDKAISNIACTCSVEFGCQVLPSEPRQSLVASWPLCLESFFLRKTMTIHYRSRNQYIVKARPSIRRTVTCKRKLQHISLSSPNSANAEALPCFLSSRSFLLHGESLLSWGQWSGELEHCDNWFDLKPNCSAFAWVWLCIHTKVTHWQTLFHILYTIYIYIDIDIPTQQELSKAWKLGLWKVVISPASKW